MDHFLFIAPALRERSSEESAELQFSRGVWGLCTGLIRANLETYLDPGSRGLVYVLKVGLCAEFRIIPPIQDYAALDALLQDELQTEARFGFVRMDDLRRRSLSPASSQALLMEVLQISDRAELTRRLKLGMHRLTQEEYEAVSRRMEDSRDGR